MWRVYLVVFKLSFMSRITYPMAAILGFGSVFVDMIIYIIFANVIFSFVPEVAGFTRDQLFIIVGTSMLIEWMSWFTFRAGTHQMPSKVVEGRIESAFVKPLPSLFLATFTRMDIEDITRAFTALMLIIPHTAAIGTPTVLHIFLYIIALLCGLAVYFALMTSISSMSFFVGKMDGLWAIVSEINDVARYPHTIFSRKVQWVFFTLLPTAFIGSVPTLVLTTDDWMKWLGVAILGATISLMFSIRMWKWTSSNYSGASG